MSKLSKIILISVLFGFSAGAADACGKIRCTTPDVVVEPIVPGG